DDGIVGGIVDRSYVYGGELSGDPFSISIESVGDVSAGGDGVGGVIFGGGSIAISQTGNVRAGEDGISVYATQVSTNTVALADGVIRGGAEGAGVRFDTPAGSASTLTTRGAVTLGSLGGDAVIGGGGDETIVNEGVLNTIGAGIDLGAGTNAFMNLAGAVFEAGETVVLGASNIFTNAGVVSPGGDGAFASTAVTGDFVQTATGALAVDVDLGSGEADLVDVTGAARLVGQVRPTFSNLTNREARATILTATDGVTDDGLEIGPLSPAVRAELLFPNETDVVLNAFIDFADPVIDPDDPDFGEDGLSDNQTEVGEALNEVFGAGSGDLAPIVDALINDIDDIGEFALALDQLSAQAFLTAGATAAFASGAFTDGLFSCEVAGGQFAAISEDQCVWMRVGGGVFDFDGDRETSPFEASGFSISGGGQARIDDDLYLNAGVGYTQSSVNGSLGTTSDIDQVQIGLSLKYQSGPWLFGAGVSGGFASIDTERRVSIGGLPTQTLTSDQDALFVTGQLRGAYLAEFADDWYVKPAIDVQVTHIDTDAATEVGGAAALSVGGLSETYLAISPSVEVGTEFTEGDLRVRPFIRAGVTHYVGNEMNVEASFANGPAGVSGFTTRSDVADTFADVAAGVTIFDRAGTSVSAGYQGRISSDATEHGGFLKLSIKF
ncbi:MAG: autotransporter domain-containing protein, partial [Pseudomonadota bacterium]